MIRARNVIVRVFSSWEKLRWRVMVELEDYEITMLWLEPILKVVSLSDSLPVWHFDVRNAEH
jgi:hypothetical protein